MGDLYGYCVHTFRHSGKLAEEFERGAKGTLEEGKPWVTARRLWTEAEGLGQPMALLFSAAETEEQSGIIYWARIDSIMIGDPTRKTECSYSSLRPVAPAQKISALRLRVGGHAVSADQIRPYIICYTPGFLE